MSDPEHGIHALLPAKTYTTGQLRDIVSRQARRIAELEAELADKTIQQKDAWRSRNEAFSRAENAEANTKELRKSYETERQWRWDAEAEVERRDKWIDAVCGGFGVTSPFMGGERESGSTEKASDGKSNPIPGGPKLPAAANPAAPETYRQMVDAQLKEHARKERDG